jgi:cell division septation protein DedD
LSDIPFDQQLERLLPDLEEPMTPPAPVERAEPAPQPAPVPGQMAAVDLPPPDQADRPAEPPAAEVAPTPPQPTTSPQAASPPPAPPSAESSRPAAEPATPRPPATAQAPEPASSRPAPRPASPDPGPTAEAALDALIAEVAQTLPRPDRRTEATESQTEAAPPRARPEPTPPSAARPREQQMAATTPNGRIDGSSTGREVREPLITAAPSQSQAASGSGYRVQLAAVREQADARRAWDLFMLDLGPILSRYQPYFERADTANGIFYRVQVGPFASAEAAETTCDELKQRNASCFVVRR